MALADTATLVVNMLYKSNIGPQTATDKSALGNFGKTVLGLAGAAGFGALTAGALQAQTAQGKFMAATGQSRDAAKQFVSGLDSLAGSAGTVGQSFDTISQVGIDVANQFGTTGQATIDLTGQFLDFAKASGQDADGAVLGLNDTMTAYGLTAADATGFMDELIASHQKFGTDIGPQTISILQQMAPQVQLLGGNIDDATGLMNAFETAGLDAGTAQRGLNTAIQKLPPGTTLDGIITKLGAIQDPADRAKEAIKIFGARAGAALAQVIQPGMTSLDDFKVSMDDAKGATQQAADNMLTDSDKIRGVFDKLSAGAREIGQDFGPLLTGLASLGSLAAPLAGGVKDLLQKILPQILPQATATGVAIGEAEADGSVAGDALGRWGKAGNIAGNAFKLAFIAGVGLIVVDVMVQQVNQAKDTIRNDPNKITPDDMVDLRAPMWAGAKVAAAKSMQDLGQASLDAFNQAWDAGIAKGMGPNDPALLNSARAAGLAVSDVFSHDSRPAFEAAGTAAAQDWRDSLTSAGTKGASDAAAKIADVFSHDSRPPLIAGSTAAAHAAADALANKQIWDASAQAITADLAGTLQQGAKTDIKSAMDKITYAIQHPLALETQEAQIQAALTSKKMQQGLASSNPEIRTVAQQQQQYLIGLWQTLTGKAYSAGSSASNALDNSLSSNYSDIRQNARGLVSDVNQIFNALQTHYNVTVAYHAGQIAKNNPPGKQYASGGYVPAGTVNTVGEEGTETLVTYPGGGAYVVPHASTSSPATRLALSVTVVQSTREVTDKAAHYQLVSGRSSSGF